MVVGVSAYGIGPAATRAKALIFLLERFPRVETRSPRTKVRGWHSLTVL